MRFSEEKHTQNFETTSQETTTAAATPTPEELEEDLRRDKEPDGGQSKPQEIIVNWEGPDDPMNPQK